MASGITFDQRAFRDGLRRKLAVTKRAVPDVLNKASRNVCLRAIAFTPKVDPSKIERELTSGGLAFRLLQAPSFQARLPKKLRGFTRGTHTRAQIDAAVRQLVALRRRSSGYQKAGWVKAAQAFGGATGKQVSSRSLAGQGYGRKATASRPEAVGVNLARGAATVGREPMQKALDFVGGDMRSYAEKKIAAAWK